ncbi:MAG: hypothetical protein A2090_05400 [Deltaproteobacteria bacterium GWD2_42_10]|nr:MAG: hypothetical protein A2090_05400 [Deltaproteobacteria bacterium GWD2_42_10]
MRIIVFFINSAGFFQYLNRSVRILWNVGKNQGYMWTRKIAIKSLAILQTGDLPTILRCRRIFALHRIGYIRLIAKMASASSGRQLTSFPKNQSLFLGWTQIPI